ncbi:MAG: type VI secretion system tip protein VgrG, partial [Comamonadaceae bacterium]
MAESSFRIQSDSPANGDLMFWSVVGYEALSRPSRYQLTVLSKNSAIEPKDILGRAFDVVIEFADANGAVHERHCVGYAVRFARRGTTGRYFEYAISLHSWFWLLGKRFNSRIFQDKTVLQVLDAVVDDSPIRSLKKRDVDGMIGVQKSRRYCVQHQESDLQFLSRLLEDEGIYYWFDAHDAPGTMYLSNASDLAHKPLPAANTLNLAPSAVSEARFNEFTRWADASHYGSGHYASRDSDFKAIRRTLSGSSADVAEHELADLEVFEFPGGYFRDDDPDASARIRMEELAARRKLYWAITSWPDVAVGRSTTLHGIETLDEIDAEHLITGCLCAATHPGYEGADTSSPLDVRRLLMEWLQEDRHDASHLAELGEIVHDSPAFNLQRGAQVFLITSIPTNIPFRPPRTAPTVSMPGPQTAIVVGAEGKEHDVDELGRVKVHFLWDRYDESNEKSTAWIRVSQPWAGNGWGGYFAPRIGQEVIVDFINGDADRPIVMGRVYNDDHKIPYKSATHSGFKTHSTPHGGVKNFNELRFEDRKDGEQVFIHAERRMDVRVKKNKYET